jgi:ubiquinone/menaquinone biosynthesis C-methylase UbiE
MTALKESHSEHGDVCPAACARFLNGWVRRRLQDPDRILAGLVNEGETVADLGCGPGFFGPALAKAVGPTGKVILVDLQEEMLSMARRHMAATDLGERVSYHRCQQDRLDLAEHLNFALAFYMVHEVPDKGAFLTQVRDALAPGGRFFIVEPKIHVSASSFRTTLGLATDLGFELVSEPRVFFSRTALLAKR